MARVVSVTGLGDFKDLEAALIRSGQVADETGVKISASFRKAGLEAAAQAAKIGASLEDQEAAAGRAAASVSESYAKMSAAQRAAGDAAATVAKKAGAAADAQIAAAKRAVDAQRSLEAAQKASADAAAAASAKTAAAAEASAARIEAAQKKLASIGKWSLFGGAAAVAASVKGAMDLQQSMMRLHTQAGATTQQVAKLQKGVLNMAGSVGTGPNELAQGLYHVVSNLNKTLPPAARVTDELKALRVAAEGAKVGGSDLVDTTNALGAAIRSGISGTQNYRQAMGALNATVGAGDMTMQNLADALGTGLLAPMKNYGVSLKDVSSALAVFGDNNLRGQAAATKLNSAIRIMSAPSKAAGEALGAVGMKSLTLANDIRSHGLVYALQDLKTHLKDSGATAAQQGLIIERAFGGRQSTGVQILLSQLGTLRATEVEVGKGADKFGAAWSAQQQTLKQKFDDLKATVQALADKFGMYLIPKLQAVATATSTVIQWFEKHKAAAEALGAVITGVLGTAVAVFAYSKAAAFVKATKNMISAMASVASKVASVSAAIENRMNGISTASEATASKVTASNATLEASNAEAGASFGTVATDAGAAGTTLDSEWAATTGRIEGLNTAMADSNVATAGSFARIAEGMGAVLSKLGPLALAFGAFEAIKQTPGIGDVFGSGSGPKTMRQVLGHTPPLRGETERAYIKHALGVPYIKGSGNKLEQAYLNLGYNPQTGPMVQRFEGLLNTVGHFGHHGFVPKQLASANGGATPSQMTVGNTHSAAWAESLLAQVHAPESKANINSLVAWIRREGNLPSVDQFNPLDTTMSGYGGHPTNSVGVQSYPNWNAGVQATAATLASYPAIMHALMAGKGLGVGGETAKELLTWSGGGYSGIGSSPASGTPSKALQDYLNGISPSKARSKALTLANRRITSGASISTTLADDASRYESLASSATSDAVKQLYLSLAKQIKDLGPKFEAEAKAAHTSAQESQVKDALKVALTGITSGLAAKVKNMTRAVTAAQGIATATAKAHAGYVKSGTTLIQRYGNVEQTGTVRTLEDALGFRSGGTAYSEFQPQHGVGSTFAPSNIRVLHDTIESMGARASTGKIGRGLGGLMNRATAGSTQGQAYEAALQNLIQSGQTREADRLVAAHKAAMQALALTMYAAQKTRDGELAQEQATMLKDQTTAIQNAATDQLNVAKAEQQKIDDMAAAVVQRMQDMQQIVDDKAAAMVTAIQDATQFSSDQSQGIITAIKDSTQIQVDKLGEKGLYGLNLVAQKLQVQADITKQFWDQKLAADQKQLDVDTQAAHVAEAAARLNLDMVTAQQHTNLAMAQQHMDTVTIAQDQRISRAQAHADAVQLSVDTSKIGPAQIAMDMNANASKSVQAKFQAQLTAATGEGDKAIAAANKQLADITKSANKTITDASNAYSDAQNAANKAIQDANDAMNNATNYWNKVIALDQQTLADDQGAAGIAEAKAGAAVSTTQEEATTQFAGSGLVINQYGVNMTNPAMMSDAASWAIRTAGVATP